MIDQPATVRSENATLLLILAIFTAACIWIAENTKN
jgi:hypothetical protein